MTLIVSLRIPDGIIIAGDSLATMVGEVEISATFDLTCPQCKKHQKVTATSRPVQMPTTSFSYAQKVFPFFNRFGVGTFGQGQLVNRTIHFATRELERNLLMAGKVPTGVEEAAALVGEHARHLLEVQIGLNGEDIAKAEDDWHPLGFQVVGYEGDMPMTVELYIGKTVEIKTVTDPGMTYSGQDSIISALLGLYEAKPKEAPLYDAFNLQDAVAFAEFIIGTTASH